MNKKVKTLIGITVSVAIIFWIYKSVDWSQVLKEIKNVNYWWFIPGTLIMFVQMLLRGIRWKYLLNKDNMSLRLRFDAIMLGNFINYILPLRAGEFARPFFASRYSDINFSAAFMSVVIERLFDLLTVLVFFVVLLFFGGVALPATVRVAAFGLLMMALGIAAVIVLAILLPKYLKLISSFFVKYLPVKLGEKVLSMLEQLIESAAVLVNPEKFIKAVFLSLLIWLVTFIQLYTLSLLLNITPSLWFGVACGVMLALAVALPSAPGFLGVYQVGCMLAFSLFGMAKEQAITFSLLTHLHQYIIILIYGAVIVLSYGIKFRELERE